MKSKKEEIKQLNVRRKIAVAYYLSSMKSAHKYSVEINKIDNKLLKLESAK